ncbi:MAG: SagB/ThcOx family dehydrogenase [Actinomycetia bacterium]|nr:SagB/ThcOx family dehydrogenase [Actinomycetes bacterium]
MLLARRSTKRFADRALCLADAAAALWAVAGTTTDGHRVCPSARATYPVVTTLIAGSVEGLPAGAYLYDSTHHAVTTVQSGDHRPTIAGATLDGVDWLPNSPALILLSADLLAARERFTDQPAEHGERFVWIEVGHAAQNLYLWAAEHNLGTALIAGLDDERAVTSCRHVLPRGHQPLGVLPLGEPTASTQ